MARKGRCPGCGSGMKLRHRFCTTCGRRNPLLTAPRARRAAAAKSAGYAPVIDLGVIRRSGLAGEFYTQPDPEQREQIWKSYISDVTKGGAA